MRILILEDESLAAERLEQLIRQYDESYQVLAVLDTVEDAVEWLSAHPAPDLAFFDIKLADGQSFQVFEATEVPCPVIFTTAYDQYALKAFKVNSIDYLLKPVEAPELASAFAQYNKLQKTLSSREVAAMSRALQQMNKNYKSRFIVRSGHQFLSLKTENILYFFSEHKMTWARHRGGKKHVVEYSLEQLEDALPPDQFFRINRQYIISFSAIEETTIYSNSRLKLSLAKAESEEEVIVSRDRVSGFKAWLDQ